jgi:hypothetical protein
MFVQEMKCRDSQPRDSRTGCAQQRIAGRGYIGIFLFIHPHRERRHIRLMTLPQTDGHCGF